MTIEIAEHPLKEDLNDRVIDNNYEGWEESDDEPIR